MTHYFCSKMIGIKKPEPKGEVSVLCDENQSSKPVVAHIDAVEEPTIDEQQDGRVYKFVRMASKDFRLPDNVSRIAKLDSDLNL
ncbi:hypothetical protein HanIR_Chr01g0034991 [Helianthus annuus]|nr:hypothetical protein HanIR_Chr01g0034991 [Helianthus annuus]